MRILVFVAALSLAAASYSPTIVPVTGYTALKTSNSSTFYTIDAPQSDYGIPVYLVDLHGSRYQMGYDYGFMLAKEITIVYNLLLHSLLPLPIEEPVVKLLEAELDYQWTNWLSVELPEQYKQEIQGIQDGCRDAGNAVAGLQVTRAIVTANMPGDLQDFIFILEREGKGREAIEEFMRSMPHKVNGMCSMWATWGNRSVNSQLFSGRNLDWNQNTGINIYKAVTIFSPDDGSIPHAVTGYVGLWGALLGISAEGLTTHEANLEENEITFSGFPWLLRLRYIMENAKNSAEAHALWEATNNTVGFNHMVASAPDAAEYASSGTQSGPGVAVVMETMFNYTAYFTDYDQRELTAMYYANSTAQGVPIGFPLHEALFRTNHGYDPLIRQHYEWSQSPDSWSMQRYMFMHDTILQYQTSGVQIDLLQAANITSIAGDKGQDPYQCQSTPDGSNVLSVAFSASTLVIAAAWENGNGTNWQPAACSSYLQLDLNQWFAGYLQAKK